MTRLKSLRLGSVAVGLAVAALAATGAAGQDGQEDSWTTQRPAGIQIFPKVVTDDGRDTCLQVSNTSNMPVFAHCFYVNGAEIQGKPLCQVTDFSLSLTRQQPTGWCVREGRRVNPTDANQGLDPGVIPSVPEGFTGGVVCVEVLASGEPSAADSLVGKATITQLDDADALVAVSGYNGIGVQAIDENDGDDIASLDDDEFRACPAGAHLNFVTEGFSDDALAAVYEGGLAAVSTTLAVVPCSFDFENLTPAQTNLSFELRDEFEGVLSGTRPVDCWGTINMGDLVGNPGTNPSTYRYARIEAEALDPNQPTAGTGFAAVANVVRVGADGELESSATNLHFYGNTADTNLNPSPPSSIRLPDTNPF